MTGDVEISDDMFIITKDTAEAYLKEKAQAKQGDEGEPQAPSAIAGAEETKQGVAPSSQKGKKEAEQLTFASMKWSGDIPSQKWMNFYTKVLSKFAARKGLSLKLHFEVTPEEGVSKQKLEETKSALRELGFNDDVETS